jgi:hypothetical protein
LLVLSKEAEFNLVLVDVLQGHISTIGCSISTDRIVTELVEGFVYGVGVQQRESKKTSTTFLLILSTKQVMV